MLAYLSACRLPVACAVVYYGKVAACLEERPKCPVMYHFGADDQSIPAADVERVRTKHPESPLYVYAGAGHGFSCEQRGSYQPQAAALARTRTLEFFARYLRGTADAGRTAAANPDSNT
jgi:carboxymethylenebutenolidase